MIVVLTSNVNSSSKCVFTCLPSTHILVWIVKAAIYQSAEAHLGRSQASKINLFARMMMMMMMMNCFCGKVDRRKAFSLISSRDHCQRSSPSRISDTPLTGFGPAQNLSSGLVEWSCAAVITTVPRRHKVSLNMECKGLNLAGPIISKCE